MIGADTFIPNRVTDAWLRARVPTLSFYETTVLESELALRGWTEAEVIARVRVYRQVRP
jgi:hypothetical protein